MNISNIKAIVAVIVEILGVNCCIPHNLCGQIKALKFASAYQVKAKRGTVTTRVQRKLHLLWDAANIDLKNVETEQISPVLA